MTAARRMWLREFQENSVARWALQAAARSCMEDACERHEAEDCPCEANRMTPLEFAEWIMDEVDRAGGPVRRFGAGRPIASINGVHREDLASTG